MKFFLNNMIYSEIFKNWNKAVSIFYNSIIYFWGDFLLNTSFSLLLSILIFDGCNLDNRRDESAAREVLRNLDGEPVIPRNANKIIIPFFHNYTSKPSISEKLTLKLRRSVNMDGRLAVVSTGRNADLRLVGMIVQYEVQPIQYGNFGEAVRKRLRIIAAVKLFDIKKREEIFYERGIQAFEVYSDLIPPISSEIQVQERVLEKLARRIAFKVVNGWYTDLMTPIEKGK